MDIDDGQIGQLDRTSNGPDRTVPRKIRVMVVDDHPAVRLGVERLLEAQPDIEIVAVCIDGESAAAYAAVRAVDVAVVDYQLPAHNGLWLCRQLKRAGSGPRVVVFSGFADHYLAACCAVAEADAVLNKGVLGSELCEAVRAVARGRRMLPRVPQPLADGLRRRLSDSEQLLFGMLLAAIPRAQIRGALGLSENELDARMSAMLRTLETPPGDGAVRGHSHSPLDLDRRAAAARR